MHVDHAQNMNDYWGVFPTRNSDKKYDIGMYFSEYKFIWGKIRVSFCALDTSDPGIPYLIMNYELCRVKYEQKRMYVIV
jgi:hypothetical protein